MPKDACPVCPGLPLTDSWVSEGNPTGYDTTGSFSHLTCSYGDPLSGERLQMDIQCYQDPGVAQKWFQYYKRQTSYPYPEDGHGSGYWTSPIDHRGVAPARFGNDNSPAPTYKSAYTDWDFTTVGRYVAQLSSTSQTDTHTQKEATAVNVRRISDFSGCFASFSPGAAPAPARQTIKGTITGTGMTKEFFQQLGVAADEATYHNSTDKLRALLARLDAGNELMTKPMRHVKIIWKGSQEAGADDKEVVTATDANGNFEIPAGLTPGKQYAFDIEFTYRKGDTDYFTVSGAGIYNVATYPHVFTYTGDADLRQDVDFNTELDAMKEDPEGVAGIRRTLYLYDGTADAFEFYADHLGEKLDYGLPLHIYPFWPDGKTRFETDTGRGNGKSSPGILITPEDSSFDNPIHSQYVIYHEFSHYAMYSLYGGKFPASPADNGPLKTINHGGYMNPSTSDSFTEGFAEFMPAVIAEYYGNPVPGSTGDMGSLDSSYDAWEYEGKAEEYAVATTLWNLYDTDKHYESERNSQEERLRSILDDPAKTAEEADVKGISVEEYRAGINREIGILQSGDTSFDTNHPVKLQFGELWQVLRTYNRDFTDVYAGLVSRYPGQKAGIDDVFVNHGFYRETDPGNGAYNKGEPWRPASGSHAAWATGDPFVDLPSPHGFHGTETIGSAGDYLRTTRRSEVPLPGHFIRTTIDVPVYVVGVDYTDHPWMNYRTLVLGDNNMVPVPVPAPGENAGVTVVPVGVQYGSPLYFRSADFNDAFPGSAARGYYVDHDFRVSGPVPARTVVGAGSTPRTGADAGIFAATGPGMKALQQMKAGNSRGLMVLLVPAGIILAGFFIVKRRW